MKKKSSILVICSISLLLFFAIAAFVISPQVVLAEDNSNTAVELLETGIELQEQGNLEEAASSYQKAIDSMEKSTFIEDFVLAKSRLIETQFLQQKMTKTEANRQLEQLKTGYESLEGIEILCSSCSRGYTVSSPFGPQCVRCFL